MSLVFFQEHWSEVIERVKDDRASMAKRLEEGKPVYFEDDKLWVLFSRKSLLAQESLMIEDIGNYIKKALRAISKNRAMNVEIVFEKQS